MNCKGAADNGGQRWVGAEHVVEMKEVCGGRRVCAWKGVVECMARNWIRGYALNQQ